LVTGASRGIGAATARLAAAQGYDVAVNYQRDKAGADAVVTDVEAAGRRAVAAQADVAIEADVERLFALIDKRLGRLTHLVCNSGHYRPVTRLDQLAAPDAREILDTNVMGTFLCARAAIPRCLYGRAGQGAPWCSSPPGGNPGQSRRIHHVRGLQGRRGDHVPRPCAGTRR